MLTQIIGRKLAEASARLSTMISRQADQQLGLFMYKSSIKLSYSFKLWESQEKGFFHVSCGWKSKTDNLQPGFGLTALKAPMPVVWMDLNLQEVELDSNQPSEGAAKEVDKPKESPPTDPVPAAPESIQAPSDAMKVIFLGWILEALRQLTYILAGEKACWEMRVPTPTFDMK